MGQIENSKKCNLMKQRCFDMKKNYSKFKILNSEFLPGAYLPVIMMVATLFMGLAIAVVTLSLSNIKLAKNHERAISALDIAESGINYYMWHLSHNNKDYCDGNVCEGTGPYGPFIHEYKDQSGKVLGSYEITITPPILGDNVTRIRSVGHIDNSDKKRTLTAELGMPSFARFSFLTNSECWFGNGETTEGPVHSNVGVHYDGAANGVVSSSNLSYTPSSSYGGDGHTVRDGVWGNGGPINYWVFPVPTVDFNKISVDFTNLRTKAIINGIHYDKSSSQGYYFHLRIDNKIDVYRVSRERTSGITTNFIETKNAPSNGILFAEDNVWVDGTYNNKITIVADTPGSGTPAIKIKDNLLYQAKDGNSSIGLVAEGNVEVPQYASNNLEIDAALLSQTGHVWYPYVFGAIKNNIQVYGSISTLQTWTWTWVSGSIVTSGYRTTSQTYDPYLTLNPPPEFPTTGTFAILSWREE